MSLAVHPTPHPTPLPLPAEVPFEAPFFFQQFANFNGEGTTCRQLNSNPTQRDQFQLALRTSMSLSTGLPVTNLEIMSFGCNNKNNK